MKLVEYSNLPPNKKYILPITESQNYGWDCKVLVIIKVLINFFILLYN